MDFERNAQTLIFFALASGTWVANSLVSAFTTPSTKDAGLDPAIIAALIGLGAVITHGLRNEVIAGSEQA
jgi:hypothetical protein